MGTILCAFALRISSQKWWQTQAGKQECKTVSVRMKLSNGNEVEHWGREKTFLIMESIRQVVELANHMVEAPSLGMFLKLGWTKC